MLHRLALLLLLSAAHGEEFSVAPDGAAAPPAPLDCAACGPLTAFLLAPSQPEAAILATLERARLRAPCLHCALNASAFSQSGAVVAALLAAGAEEARLDAAGAPGSAPLLERVAQRGVCRFWGAPHAVGIPHLSAQRRLQVFDAIVRARGGDPEAAKEAAAPLRRNIEACFTDEV